MTELLTVLPLLLWVVPAALAPPLIGGLVAAQARRILGDHKPWPGIDWPSALGMWAFWLSAVLALKVMGVSGLGEILSTLINVGVAIGILAATSHYADKLPDDRKDLEYPVALGGLLAAAAALISVFLVIVLAVVLLFVGASAKGNQPLADRLGNALADVGAGLKLRGHQLEDKSLDVGGIPVEVERVGVFQTDLTEGGVKRSMRNEHAIALLLSDLQEP